jgi:hypothetical protein
MNRTTGIITAAALVILVAPSLSGQAQQPPAQPMGFFVTSVGPGDGGNLGGLAGADKHCQQLAAAAGAGNRTWRAYLSQAAAGSQPPSTPATASAAALVQRQGRAHRQAYMPRILVTVATRLMATM